MITEKELERILNGDAKLLNSKAKELGGFYAREGLTTSQIRNVFDEIQNMAIFTESVLQLLKPKIAYTAGRNYRVKVLKQDFYPMMEKLIDMTNANNFTNFKNFIEAIVAYHRFEGGKE